MADSPRISDESIDVANRLSAIAFPEMFDGNVKARDEIDNWFDFYRGVVMRLDNGTTGSEQPTQHVE